MEYNRNRWLFRFSIGMAGAFTGVLISVLFHLFIVVVTVFSETVNLNSTLGFPEPFVWSTATLGLILAGFGFAKGVRVANQDVENTDSLEEDDLEEDDE